jgi:hypothetical protein
MLFRRFVLFALFTATSLLSAQQSAISRLSYQELSLTRRARRLPGQTCMF